MSAESAPPPRPPRITVELLLAAAATFLSLCALVVSLLQTRIAREQQHASVWPFLRLGGQRLDRAFTLILENRGVGPALIRRVEVVLRGRPQTGHVEAIKGELQGYEGPKFYSVLRIGDVIKAGEEIRLFHVDQDDRRADHLQGLIHRGEFVMRVSYADVYGNCWIAGRDGVQPLSRCPDR